MNCNGAPGRFRIETMDDGFSPIDSPKGLDNLVKNAVRSLDEWVIEKTENNGKDHSKYLRFKFVNGQIDAIMH